MNDKRQPNAQTPDRGPDRPVATEQHDTTAEKQRRPFEWRGWHGEGVVGARHTD